MARRSYGRIASTTATRAASMKTRKTEQSKHTTSVALSRPRRAAPPAAVVDCDRTLRLCARIVQMRATESTAMLIDI